MQAAFRKCWRNFSYPRPAIRVAIRFSSSSFIVRIPPASAPREVPTPLLFVSCKTWDEDSAKGITTLSSMLAEKGFTCIQTDLAKPEGPAQVDSTLLMQSYELDLLAQFRLSSIPFPPVIFARGSACLIAETYISSQPASGMVLIDPPVSNAELHAQNRLPSKLETFNYEPHFPIAVIATPEKVQELKNRGHRLQQSEYVDIIPVKDLNEIAMFNEVELWLDKLGI